MATKAKHLALSVGNNIDASGNVDSDTLDNLDSTQFLRSDADDSLTGYIDFSTGLRAGEIAIGGVDSTSASYNVTIKTINDNPLYLQYDSGQDVHIGQSSNPVDLLVSGNVGIGTTSPGAKLEVKGVSSAPSDGAQIFQVTNSTGGTKLAIGVEENTGAWIRSYESGVGGRNLILQDIGGNVGIGTTSPASRLDVKGAFRITRGVDAGHVSEGNWLFNISHEDAARYGSLYLVPSVSTAEIDLASKVRIKNNGNVGIGTTNPDAKLHVSGEVLAGVADTANSAYYGLLAHRALGSGLGGYGMHFESGFENPIIWGYDNGNNGGKIRFATMTSGSDRTLGNGLTDRMVIETGTGNVGIGTESPASPLDIEVGTGSWQSGLTLTRSDNGNDFAFVIDGVSGNRLNIGQPSGVGRIRIEEDKNGYIELSSPSAVALPQGNDANRPSTPTKGDFRYNTGSDKLEYYNNAEWKEVGIYVPFSDYATSGLQVFFDANRTESWASGSNPYNLIDNSQSSLTNVSNSITTDSPAGAKAMYFNDTGNCRWPGGVQPFPRTYEVWVCSKDWTGTNWQSFTDDGSVESILFGTPDASPRVYTSTSSSSNYALSNNTWYQIAYTCSGLSSGSGTIYVNGSSAFGYSGLSRSGPGTGSTLYMGGDAGQAESMFGWIAILRCYDRILSSNEILQNWNNDKSKFGY